MLAGTDRYDVVSLAPDIERYKHLLSEGRFESAYRVFRERLDRPTRYGLTSSLRRAPLLEMLFADGLDSPPRLERQDDQAYVLYALGQTYTITGGYPGRAIPLFERHREICERIGDEASLCASAGHYAKALRQAGQLRESEAVALQGLILQRERHDYLREAVNLYWLGIGLAQRGQVDEAEAAFGRAQRIFQARHAAQSEGVVSLLQAQRALLLDDDAATALRHANRAWEIGMHLEDDDHHEDLHGAVKIKTAAARMQGEALIRLGDVALGEERLHYALNRSRAIDFVEEQLPTLGALASFATAQGKGGAARASLRLTWELAARGPYVIHHADSYNTLAAMERAVNQPEAAVEAARTAYQLAWCDGPPFAYSRGLTEAAAHLEALGAVPPSLPRFDELRYVPLPEVEINPADEFGG